jgi:hypothetical protein
MHAICCIDFSGIGFERGVGQWSGVLVSRWITLVRKPWSAIGITAGFTGILLPRAGIRSRTCSSRCLGRRRRSRSPAAARDAQAAAARAVEAARAAQDAQAAGDQQAVAAQVAAVAEAAAEVNAAAERAAEAANAAREDAPPPGAAPPLEPGKGITPINQQILLPEIFRTSNLDIPSLRKVLE